MTRLLLPLLTALPFAAQAGPVCTFTEECFGTFACEETDYSIEVILDTPMILSSMIEDLEVVYSEVTEDRTQLVARGLGSLNLLTIGGDRALMSVHIGSAPSVVTYHGTCEAGT